MSNRTPRRALLSALLLSTFLVGCGEGGDTDRAALERESLEHELQLALQPDTTQAIELSDVPLEAADEPEAPPVAAPTPAPRPSPRPASPAPPVVRTPPRPSSPAPTPAPAPAPAPARPRVVSYPVPAGTTFAVRLNEELSTRNHTAGSTFTATLTDPIVGPDGTTLIPAGATVRGRVVDSSPSGRAGQDASLSVEFTSISSGGRTYAISGSVADAPVRLVTRDGTAEKAAKIGGGAAVGAVLGRVIGRSTKSTIAGAAIGAAAGTAVAMGTADVDAVVDAGSRVTVRLDRSVTIERET